MPALTPIDNLLLPLLSPDRVGVLVFEAYVAGNSFQTPFQLLSQSLELLPTVLSSGLIVHVEGRITIWAESYTKLLAFNQTQYDRVLSLDSDATVLQPMDELFLLPPCPVAMPRAYWGNFDDRVLGSYIMLIQPSEFEFNRVMKAIKKASDSKYDMEIVNHLYRDSALILPHRPYGLLTGEFRSNHHTAYLGNDDEVWDPDQVFKEAKYMHSSDWPVSKPWNYTPQLIIQENQPICHNDTVSGAEDCRSRDLWLGFYSDFAQRREKICGMGLEMGIQRTFDKRRPHAYEPVFG
ncbi:nucleotide-diphospho-sugar transferase [Aspergillus sergii]|uniref:Nucleotide-diphospho-sugar transferase n=1 Tax=Aspergillus sergii TaxID=1034303 RepID=A0A5N6XDY3_9EURO|nr:nucleotide-diphospho-sugar transferase [Aspergillus sergii]